MAYNTPRRLLIWRMKARIRAAKPLFTQEQRELAARLDLPLCKCFAASDIIECETPCKRHPDNAPRDIPELTDRQRAFHSGTEGFKLPEIQWEHCDCGCPNQRRPASRADVELLRKTANAW